MMHSAKPTVSPIANIVFTLFCFARFLKVGTDGRTDGRKHMRNSLSQSVGAAGRPSGSKLRSKNIWDGSRKDKSC